MATAVSAPLPQRGSESLTTLPERIRAQVEFYFSVENMTRDKFLLSIMNARMMVPLSVIAGFNKVRLLTEDAQVLQQALFDSTRLYLEYDEAGELLVGPAAQASPRSRATLILLNLPQGTTREDLQRLAGQPILHTFTFPDGSWHLTFESDRQCKLGLATILQQASVLGIHLQARVRVQAQQKAPPQPPRASYGWPGFGQLPMPAAPTGNTIGYVARNPVAGHPLFVNSTGAGGGSGPPPMGPPPAMMAAPMGLLGGMQGPLFHHRSPMGPQAGAMPLPFGAPPMMPLGGPPGVFGLGSAMGPQHQQHQQHQATAARFGQAPSGQQRQRGAGPQQARGSGAPAVKPLGGALLPMGFEDGAGGISELPPSPSPASHSQATGPTALPKSSSGSTLLLPVDDAPPPQASPQAAGAAGAADPPRKASTSAEKRVQPPTHSQPKPALDSFPSLDSAAAGSVAPVVAQPAAPSGLSFAEAAKRRPNPRTAVEPSAPSQPAAAPPAAPPAALVEEPAPARASDVAELTVAPAAAEAAPVRKTADVPHGSYAAKLLGK